MRKNLALFIFVLLAICAFGAPKGGGSPLEVLSRIPDVNGTTVTPVYSAGAWVEYLATDDKGEQTKMKFSILSKEKCDSLDCFWFELKMTDKDKQWVILKFKGTDPKKQESMTSFITQTQGEPAYEMSFMIPKQDGKKAEKDKDKPEIKPEITITENVTVTVPAGTFVADKYSLENVTYWATSSVPMPLKVSYSDGSMVMELVSYT